MEDLMPDPPTDHIEVEDESEIGKPEADEKTAEVEVRRHDVPTCPTFSRPTERLRLDVFGV